MQQQLPPEWKEWQVIVVLSIISILPIVIMAMLHYIVTGRWL